MIVKIHDNQGQNTIPVEFNFDPKLGLFIKWLFGNW